MDGLEVVSSDTDVDAVYGKVDFEITMSDIAELLKGNRLVGTVNNEYVITIKLQEEKRK
jgi:hypothetical protein